MSFKSSCNASGGFIQDIFLYGFIPSFEICAAVISVFTIILMTRTPGLRGLAGAILINDQITCLSDQLIVGLFCTDLRVYLSTDMQIYAVDIPLQTFTNASVTFMLLSNVNIYLALCKADSYKRLVTKPRAAMAIAFVWISCSGVAMLTLLDDKDVHLQCAKQILFAKSSLDFMPVNLTKTVLFLIFPLGFSCLFLKKVVNESSAMPRNMTLRSASARRKVLKLVRLLLVFTIITTVLYVFLKGLRIVASFTENGPVESVASAIGIITRLVRGLRPFVLALCYRPLRDTFMTLVRKLMPQNRVRTSEIPTVQLSSVHVTIQNSRSVVDHPL